MTSTGEVCWFRAAIQYGAAVREVPHKSAAVVRVADRARDGLADGGRRGTGKFYGERLGVLNTLWKRACSPMISIRTAADATSEGARLTASRVSLTTVIRKFY